MELECIVQSDVKTVVMVVAPFQRRVIVHVCGRHAVCVAVLAAGHGQVVVGAPGVAPYHVVPVGVEECQVLRIGEHAVQRVAVAHVDELALVFLHHLGVGDPSVGGVTVVHICLDLGIGPFVDAHGLRGVAHELVGVRSVVFHAHLVVLTLLGGDQHDAAGGLRTVD